MNLTLEYESFQDFASKLWPHLSEEGMWIPSDNPAGVGELVDFDVMLADGFRLFHGTGQVIAVGPGPEIGAESDGMTLRFSQLDQPSRNLVRKVVSKHIGEGGKLFVLSTPGTKVEVVGDDEAQAPGGEGEKGTMGPEDLVAPFAGLEADTAWSGEAEPELSSFLKPRGGAVDIEAGSELPEDGFALTPPENAVEEPVIPAPDAEVDLGSSSTAVEDLDAGSGQGLDEPSDLPVVEAWDTVTDDALAPSLTEVPEPAPSFEQSLAETQRIEPAALNEEAQGEIALEAEAFPPMPSTVIPPPLAEFGGELEGEDEDPSTDEFYPHGASSSSGRTWWPWVVVGGLAIGAGLYALLQLDTPLSGLFGGEDKAEQTASEAVASPQPREAGSQSAKVGLEETADASAIEFAGEAVAGEGESAEGESAEGESAEGESAEGEAAVEGPVDAIEPATAAPAPADHATAGDREADLPTEPAPSQAPAPTPAAVESVTASAAPAEADLANVDQPASLRLQRITWRDVEGDTVVRLALGGPLTDDRFETQRVAGGSPRVVLKMLGAAGGVPRSPVAIGSDHVQQLRFGVHNIDGVRQVHAVADLVEESVELVGSAVVREGAVELRFSRP